MMDVILIATCVLLYVLAGQPGWLADGPLALRMMSYHFFHANIAHLLVNGIAAATLFAPRHRDNIRVFAAGFVIASLVYPLSAQPCIGISNILYAVIGLRTPPFTHRWWRSASVVTFLAVTASMLFIPGVSGLTHIVSLAAGIAAANIMRRWRS